VPMPYPSDRLNNLIVGHKLPLKLEWMFVRYSENSKIVGKEVPGYFLLTIIRCQRMRFVKGGFRL
jgi:hypothetical protein